MKLRELLAPRREAIVGEGLRGMVAAWPSPAASFLSGRDPFRNPVGRVMRGAMDAAFDALTSDTVPVALPPAVAELVALRAVQPDGESDPSVLVGALAASTRAAVSAADAPADAIAHTLRLLDERVAAFAQLAAAEHGRCRARIDAIRHREAAGLPRPARRAPGRALPFDAVRRPTNAVR